jgi:hypothetical protein
MMPMNAQSARSQALLFIVTALILLILTFSLAIELLPAAPGAPTPTLPKGLDLPDQLPRIPR